MLIPENYGTFISILSSWRNEAFKENKNKSKYIFSYKLNRKGILILFSNYPGYLIGYKGELISKYSQKLKQIKEINKVEIEEISTV